MGSDYEREGMDVSRWENVSYDVEMKQPAKRLEAAIQVLILCLP